ncbi:glycoside hydrolase family 16 protein [Aspergillus clavatus NRRL 1]|uniref:endo-1,3(4)-beta-glucanase n=1 Tax=Aspergillus clavatus (strain ATCC 1007 / CBS 513.65 / DSM 816 / NCTC 3887 / NRRL 1 / QM 1276 / 107) TaxID=344612 RepID=A1C5B8_ASPCL|nr:endo-1,3(4)-beta-glucanase, putative [Aspergillus clavatus NRRL 1]EAW14886.1 endo-1,3(4)-beta-glucanase, putative [Aspergillus clavatus NRRL 1]
MAEKSGSRPGDAFSQAGAASSHYPHPEDKDRLYDLHGSAVPAPYGTKGSSSPHRTLPWYNPRGWSLRRKLIAGGIIVVVLIAAIVGAVEGTRATRYPDYTRLDYKLADTYAGTDFLDKFNYFSDEDPTNGFVQYVDRIAAQTLNLTYATESSVVLRVDTTTPFAKNGRQSVRLESKRSYDTGLFVFDILHTPFGCGTWPALWLSDTYNWPLNGEIDVVETNNGGTEGNSVTLHTTRGCDMKAKRKQTGQALYQHCDNSTHGNAGCGVQGEPYTYGPEFNDNGGGVYALELRSAGIRAWFFPRAAIPSDILDGIPDPSMWGTPLADFPNTNCDIPFHFTNQSIIANIDLCGQLGAQRQFYTELYKCPGICSDFVAHNPSKFTEAYWEFKTFKVYQAQWS